MTKCRIVTAHYTIHNVCKRKLYLPKLIAVHTQLIHQHMQPQKTKNETYHTQRQMLYNDPDGQEGDVKHGLLNC